MSETEQRSIALSQRLLAFQRFVRTTYPRYKQTFLGYWEDEHLNKIQYFPMLGFAKQYTYREDPGKLVYEDASGPL